MVARVNELTGDSGADIAFECVGASPALKSALDSTRSGGTVVNVSIWVYKAEIDMFGLVMREIQLIGTNAYCNDHEAVIKLLQERKDPGGPVHQWPHCRGRCRHS